MPKREKETVNQFNNKFKRKHTGFLGSGMQFMSREEMDDFYRFNQYTEYKRKMEQFQAQKETFAQGLFLNDNKKPGGQKNVSPLKSALTQNTLFHSSLIKQELFSFLEPADPFKPKTPSTTGK